MKIHQGLKLFFVLLISTLFIYSFSHIGARAYNSITINNNLFSPETFIGSVDVSGKSADDALNLITEQVEKWKGETVILLKYKEKEVPLDLNIYQIDLLKSIGLAQNGKKNAVISSLESDVLIDHLGSISQELSFTDEEMNALQNQLIHYSENLILGKNVVSVEQALATEQTTEIVNELTIEISDVSGAGNDWINEMSPIHIPSNSQVSFLNLIEKHQPTSISNEMVSIIASGVYEVILPTNFEIIERHISQELPDNVDLGFEAKVSSENNLDLIFANPNGQDFIIELTFDDHELRIQLKGSSFLYKYNIEHTDKQEYKPRTIIQYSPQLLPSESRVLAEGKAGSLIRILRKVYDEHNQLVSEEVISEDFYAPTEKIVVRGLKAVNSTSDNTETNQLIEGNQVKEPIESKLPTKTEEELINDTEQQTPSTEIKHKEAVELWGKPNEQEK